jgi:hypothetical protein
MRGLLAAALVVAVGCGKKPAVEADPAPVVQAEPTRKAEPAPAKDPLPIAPQPAVKPPPEPVRPTFDALEFFEETREYPTRYTGKVVRVRVRAETVRQSGEWVTFSQRVDPEFPFPEVSARTRFADAPDVRRGDVVEVTGYVTNQNHKLTVEVTGRVDRSSGTDPK